MARVEEIRTVCRFCLGRQGLMPLSEATRTAFAIKDVIRYTGILVSCDKLPYAICDECCKVIKNAENFRQTCLRNDIYFKKLAEILCGSVRKNAARKEFPAVDTSLYVKIDSQHSTSDALYEAAKRSETPIITLDDSDADDGMPVQGKNENDSSPQNSNPRTLDGGDSDDSMPSLYSEVMQRPLNDTLINDSRACHLEDAGKEHSTIASSQETDNDAATSSVGISLISPDGSDTDDSMPSLYGDAMAEAKKEQQNKRNAPGPADPDVPKKSRKELCQICGFMTLYLPNHIKLRHHLVKKLVCKCCQKRFVYQFDLKRHMNTRHEKRIILTCEHCGRGFTNHSSHFYHMKNSHGESDVYECETCHRKFKSIDGYRKHQKEHSITSYPCPYCDKLFKTPVTLGKHQLRYHPTEHDRSSQIQDPMLNI
uniref:ZAD domain-containing protein n=1 Tax=Anopheles atroparvus TaxID=41427 RepID=A0AAG5DHL3_ANOAO